MKRNYVVAMTGASGVTYGIRLLEALTTTGCDVQLSITQAAVDVWKTAAKVEQSARTAFGLARALYAAGDPKAAKQHAEQTLAHSQGHVGARVVLARIEWTSRGTEQSAIKLLEEAKQTGNASRTEVVELQTLLGDIHLARSRISHAEAAYADALKLSPKSAGALRGLGEALYRAVQMARPQDIVLACGKGHEQSMCFGTVEYDWDERDALRAALRGSPLRTLPTAK